MVTAANNKKNILLGMPHGTAHSRLRKLLLFHLCCKLELDICYRCKTKISTIDEFSIEHTEDWQSSDDPLSTFLDVEKIAFSHLKCNIAESGRNKIYESKKARKKAQYVKMRNDPEKYQAHLDYKKELYHKRNGSLTG